MEQPTRDQVARQVRVHGTVQGVFYRATCVDRAQQAGVRGWVRNEPDGTVSAHLEGTREAVDQMIAWCREGSPGARVAGLEVTTVTPEGHDGFEQRA